MTKIKCVYIPNVAQEDKRRVHKGLVVSATQRLFHKVHMFDSGEAESHGEQSRIMTNSLPHICHYAITLRMTTTAALNNSLWRQTPYLRHQVPKSCQAGTPGSFIGYNFELAYRQTRSWV